VPWGVAPWGVVPWGVAPWGVAPWGVAPWGVAPWGRLGQPRGPAVRWHRDLMARVQG